MGAWGTDNWQNDDALDWAAELSDLGAIPVALAVVLGEEEYPDTGACCRALAAAEVVAALNGQPGVGMPDHVKAWIDLQEREPGSEWATTALRAVARIKRDSELQELFDEGGRNVEWHSVLENLSRRLTATIRQQPDVGESEARVSGREVLHSYWNAYFRPQFPQRADYPALRVLADL